jgi:DNA-binding HxlR family transcriptional regulator
MITQNELAVALNHLTTERIMDREAYAERLWEAYSSLLEEEKPINDGKVIARAIIDYLSE